MAVNPGLATSTRGPAGFAESFDDLHRATYQAAFKLLGRRHDAEDIAQEACARACLRWKRLEHPNAWAVRVATNLAIDRWRRLQREAAAGTEQEKAVAPSDGMRIDLHRALAQLPKRQRDVVMLRYVADMSEAQTASALGLSPGTVQTHAARGLQALRTTLDLPEEP